MKLLKAINEELKAMEKQLGVIQRQKKELQKITEKSINSPQTIALEHEERRLEYERNNLAEARKIIQDNEIIEGPRFIIS